MHPIDVLASDMDGTFIPLDGNEENERDLTQLCDQLRRHQMELVYVTGRHYELVLEAIESHGLPQPEWLICDVGASIYRESDGRHGLVREYHDHLGEIVGAFGVEDLRRKLAGENALRLQEAEKQGRFKLSYYCDQNMVKDLGKRLADQLDRWRAPYRLIASVDPFTGNGLIDFLPRGTSKDYALRWWVDHNRYDHRAVIFAGDSGNDVAALTAGYRSVIVSNADASVAKEVSEAHQAAGWTDRLYLAKKPATSGVLEGVRHFLGEKTVPI